MAKYRAILDKQLATKYAWPDGWDRPEKVALDLGCTLERLADVIRPCVADGSVERKEFKVFEGGKFRRVIGYREPPAKGGKR